MVYGLWLMDDGLWLRAYSIYSIYSAYSIYSYTLNPKL